MKRLPFDVIFFNIIPYTYNLQNKQLLHDIVNYRETKSILLQLYYNFWISQGQHDEPEDKNWLINDIYAYANNDVAGMYGRVEQFYNIFKRYKVAIKLVYQNLYKHIQEPILKILELAMSLPP
jgi:hypothetical protein